MRSTLRGRQAALLLGFTAVLLASPLSAQIPDEFTNLKLLDPEIEKNQLVGTMRDWAMGLGVRCNHCHVGPDNLEGMDFASDEKATKRTARKMLELSRAVNRELLAELPTVTEDGRARAQVVSCYTCHRGMAKPPRQAFIELGEVARAEGPDAALETYDTLKEEHYGAGRYDLRSGTLDQLGVAYAQGGKPDEARKVLEGNAARHPDSADTQATLGFVLMRAGDTAAARAAYERALELVPDHEGATRGLALLDKSR